MRKYLFYLLLSVLPFMGNGQLLNEGFEGTTFPPTGWTTFTGTNGLGTGFNWSRATTAPYQGAGYAFVRYEDVTGGIAEDWMVTPAIDLSDYENAELTFFTRQDFNPDWAGDYYVKVSTTSQTSHASFTDVATWTELTLNTTYNVYEQKAVDLSAYDGQTIYLAFVMTNDDGDSWYIDDVVVNADEVVVTPTGCLTATFGLYPSTTYTPACFGVGTIVTDAWAGEYSNVNVTAGTEYTFASSVATDFITIGNAAGTTVLTSGTGSVTWTAPASEIVRFYTHADAACANAMVSRARTVECGEPFVVEEPAYDCFQGDGLASNGPEDGNGINPTSNFRVADDFTVATGETFSLEYVRMNVLTASNVNSATLNIRADAAGMPGAVLHTVTMAPTTQVLAGGAFGFNLNQLEFVLATPIDLTEGVYWLEPTATNTTVGTVYWEVSSTGTDGSVAYNSNTSGASWVANADGLRTVFYVAGVCEAEMEGCLTASEGQFPSATFVPTCLGTVQNITTNAWAGEYSKVSLTAGTEYIFSVTPSTDFITIGDDAGTTVLAFGTGSVTYTPATDMVVRFYQHVDDSCTEDDSISRVRSVQCGEIPIIEEPAFECFQGDGLASNGPEDGLNISPTTAFRNADDFIVADGSTFTVQQVRMNILSASPITNLTLNFRADNAGAPGAVEETVTMAPSSSRIVAVAFGFNVYEVTLDLATALEFEAGTYWLQPEATNQAGNGAIYWEMSSTGTTGAIAQSSEDSGATWTANEFGYNAIFFVAGECDTVVVTEGCLDAENGQYPSTTFVPACLGTPEDITTLGWTGEYSVLEVTNGVEYIFTVSDPTYFITIGDSTGTTVIASGTGSLTWTANLDGEVRFYTHFNSDCEWDAETFLTRTVQCGETPIITEPDFPCFQGDGLESNGPEDGLNISPNTAFRNADDFIVEDMFTIQQVRMNILSTSPITEVTLNFRADAAGSPGAVEETVTMAPTSQRVVGAAFGFNAYEVTMDLATALEFESGTYWLQPEAANEDATDGAIYWEMSSTGTTGEIAQSSEDSGSTWAPNEFGYNAIFFVAGTCEVIPNDPCNQEVLSNNLENGLFLGGADSQRLAVDITVDANRRMTISSIEPTIIVPEGSEATTFSFIFYTDEAGLPGTEVDNATGTITSSTVTGQNFGRDFIRYSLDLDADVVLEAGTYWMEMESDAEGWEATTASVLGSTLVFSNASTAGEWVVDGTGTELVYQLVATCEDLGVSDLDSFDFAYYPNPVKDELNITSQKIVQSVSVYNLAGQQVSTQKLNVSNGKVSTSSLSAGVYVFRAVLEGGQVETFKVIKK